MKERHVNTGQDYFIDDPRVRFRRRVRVLDGPLEDGRFLVEFYRNQEQRYVFARSLHQDDGTV